MIHRKLLIDNLVREYREEMEDLTDAELESHVLTLRKMQGQADPLREGIEIVQPRPEKHGKR